MNFHFQTEGCGATSRGRNPMLLLEKKGNGCREERSKSRDKTCREIPKFDRILCMIYFFQFHDFRDVLVMKKWINYVSDQEAIGTSIVLLTSK